MRKPNLQSPLDRLTDDQQHEIYLMLVAVPGSEEPTKTYAEAIPLIRESYGVRTTDASLSRFLQRRRLIEELRTANYCADAFAKDADVKALDRRNRAAVTAALWKAITTNAKEDIVAFGKLALAQKADDRAEQELALARDKFELNAAKLAMKYASEIKTISADDALDAEAKVAKVREALFGKKES